MKPRLVYEVDPHNRLIIKKSGKSSDVKRFRKVITGRFKIDTKNRLSYEVFKSSASDIPQKIKFSGVYSMNKSHNLIYTLDKWNDQYAGNRLRLKTGIQEAKGNEIVFLLNSKMSSRKKSVYTLRLHGAWQADKNNRLVFDISKEGEKPDRVTFLNAWKINKRNEIEYRCSRGSNIIRLKGYWGTRNKNRLSYILDKSINSGFDFRTSLARVVLRKEKTSLRFAITIDISKKKRIKRDIVFSGTLKLDKGKKIYLEVSPNKRKRVRLKLTREILGQKGLMYIESFLKGKERYLGGGIILKW